MPDLSETIADRFNADVSAVQNLSKLIVIKANHEQKAAHVLEELSQEALAEAFKLGYLAALSDRA